MTIHIIIDGYNFIRQSKEIIQVAHSLEDERNQLINALADYKKDKQYKITVVFDGPNDYSLMPAPSFIKGIEIKFSSGEIADKLIKKICEKEREKALIVSSDNDITHYAISQNSAVISSREFEQKLFLNNFYDEDFLLGEEKEKVWSGNTKKKGQGKKLPKKARKSKAKISKL